MHASLLSHSKIIDIEMDLTNLKYFSAVADTGSFSRAAISLNMAQPSISRAVKLLEEEFGQLLLERNVVP